MVFLRPFLILDTQYLFSVSCLVGEAEHPLTKGNSYIYIKAYTKVTLVMLADRRFFLEISSATLHWACRLCRWWRRRSHAGGACWLTLRATGSTHWHLRGHNKWWRRRWWHRNWGWHWCSLSTATRLIGRSTGRRTLGHLWHLWHLWHLCGHLWHLWLRLSWWENRRGCWTTVLRTCWSTYLWTWGRTHSGHWHRVNNLRGRAGMWMATQKMRRISRHCLLNAAFFTRRLTVSRALFCCRKKKWNVSMHFWLITRVNDFSLTLEKWKRRLNFVPINQIGNEGFPSLGRNSCQNAFSFDKIMVRDAYWERLKMGSLISKRIKQKNKLQSHVDTFLLKFSFISANQRTNYLF